MATRQEFRAENHLSVGISATAGLWPKKSRVIISLLQSGLNSKQHYSEWATVGTVC